MAKAYQMLWDCQFCGTQKLLAKTHRACPKCKAPQDPAQRYFPSATNKVAVENDEFKGKDKTCVACNSLNVATAKFCRCCGASLDDADVLKTTLSSGRGDGAVNQTELKNHFVLQEQIHITEEALATGSWPEEIPEAAPEQPQPLSRQSYRKSSKQSLFAYSSPIEKFAFITLATIGCLIYGPFLIGIVLVIMLSL